MVYFDHLSIQVVACIVYMSNIYIYIYDNTYIYTYIVSVVLCIVVLHVVVLSL